MAISAARLESGSCDVGTTDGEGTVLATAGEKKEDDAALALCWSRLNWGGAVSVDPLGPARAICVAEDQAVLGPLCTADLAAVVEPGNGGLGGQSVLRL